MRVRVPPSAWCWPALVLVLLAAACDRSVTDPTLDADDVDALLAAAGIPIPAARHTLPALLDDAVREVQRERGTAAARAWIRPLAELRARSEAAPADSGALAALRAGQLRLVLSLRGTAAAERVIAAERTALAAALPRLDAEGARADALREWERRARRELAAAEAAAAASDSLSALEHATSAAEAVARLRRGLVELDHVMALPELLGRVRAEGAGGDRLGALQESARTGLRSGNRERAYRAVTALRREEIAVVLERFGPGVAADVTGSVERALAALPARIDANVRLNRMLRSARDLNVRATDALRGGDAATALDLSSHAAGLVNALRLALAPR